MLKILTAVLALATFLGAAPAIAQTAEFTLVIQDHRFTPAELRVPANKRIRLVIENRDATPEEFESHSLKIEKVIPGKAKGTVNFGPVKPGRYEFVGEFNEKTAKGVLIAD